MNQVKVILLGFFVGLIAFYINIVSIGFVGAYMPITLVEITEGMTQKNIKLLIEAYFIFETFLAALPMAIAGYIFMLVFKLKADKLFLTVSVGVLLICHLYILYLYKLIKITFNIFLIIDILVLAVPCILLWFALIAPNKQLKNGRLKAAL